MGKLQRHKVCFFDCSQIFGSDLNIYPEMISNPKPIFHSKEKYKQQKQESSGKVYIAQQ